MEKKYFSNRIRDLDKKKNTRYQTHENSEDLDNNTIGLDESNENPRTKSQYSSMHESSDKS